MEGKGLQSLAPALGGRGQGDRGGRSKGRGKEDEISVATAAGAGGDGSAAWYDQQRCCSSSARLFLGSGESLDLRWIAQQSPSFFPRALADPSCFHRARQSNGGDEGSSHGGFTPSGDFTFSAPPHASTSSFRNPYAQNNGGNGFGVPSESSDGSDESDSEDSEDEVEPEKADNELTDEEKLARAADRKEQGNVAYKKGDYATATRFYTHAIELDPSNAPYYLNRAASRMSSKIFSSALEDCLVASSLQKADPQAKTLLRTAKCQLALGIIGPAQQSLQEAFRLEPSNRAIAAEKARAEKIATHVVNIKRSLEKKDWSMVLLGVDAAVRDSETEQTPKEWRVWKLEALIGKKRYDEANSMASYVQSFSSPFSPRTAHVLLSVATFSVSTRSSLNLCTTVGCASTSRATTTRVSSTPKKR